MAIETKIYNLLSKNALMQSCKSYIVIIFPLQDIRFDFQLKLMFKEYL